MTWSAWKQEESRVDPDIAARSPYHVKPYFMREGEGTSFAVVEECDPALPVFHGAHLPFLPPPAGKPWRAAIHSVGTHSIERPTFFGSANDAMAWVDGEVGQIESAS